jgi:hypothetical protein
MMEVWAVFCENEYTGKALQMLCGSEELANEVCALMQDAADDGTPPLQETFYGEFSVEGWQVAETMAQTPEAFYLADVLVGDWLERLEEDLPDWYLRLAPILGVVPTFKGSLVNPFEGPEWETYVADVYARWDEHDSCRVTIPGEGMWGKQLPEFGGVSLVGMNNMPLDGRYAWQDIYQGSGINLDPDDLVHRRWKNRIWFGYTEDADDKEVGTGQRQRLLDLLKPIGFPGFFCPGMGYILMEEPEHEVAAAKVFEVLGELGWPYESEDDEDEDG